VQTGPVLARLEGMLNQISHFKRVDLGEGLSKWQTRICIATDPLL
jgi:hypothetical protein